MVTYTCQSSEKNLKIKKKTDETSKILHEHFKHFQKNIFCFFYGHLVFKKN